MALECFDEPHGPDVQDVDELVFSGRRQRQTVGLEFQLRDAVFVVVEGDDLLRLPRVVQLDLVIFGTWDVC